VREVRASLLLASEPISSTAVPAHPSNFLRRSVMSIGVCNSRGGFGLCASVLLTLAIFNTSTVAQVQLPEVVVSAPKEKPKPRPKAARAVPAPAPATPVTPAAQLNTKADSFDQSRSSLYTTIGTPRLTRFLVATTSRSRKSCCRLQGSHRILRRAAYSMCVTITPTFNFASMA
jgi:hypothetical protein